MAEPSQLGISLTVRPGSDAIFDPNGPPYAIPAPGDQPPTRNAGGPPPVG
jgi:hypothetical protein